MKDIGKVTVNIRDVLGIAKPFPQGGVWRLTVPEKVVKKHDLNVRRKKGRYFAYVFVDTDKGLLLVPLDKVVNPETLRGALEFIDISHLNDEDLKILFEEET
jgi:hypothetical protein